MELQSFLAALEERIARYDLLCHPYYKAWTAGQLTRDDLREYASDYYHHVAAFPAYLSALHSRLDDGEPRRAVLRGIAPCDQRGHTGAAARGGVHRQFPRGQIIAVRLDRAFGQCAPLAPGHRRQRREPIAAGRSCCRAAATGVSQRCADRR